MMSSWIYYDYRQNHYQKRLIIVQWYGAFLATATKGEQVCYFFTARAKNRRDTVLSFNSNLLKERN